MSRKTDALAAVVASAETSGTPDLVWSDGTRKPHTAFRDKATVEAARAAGVTDAQILATVERKTSRAR